MTCPAHFAVDRLGAAADHLDDDLVGRVGPLLVVGLIRPGRRPEFVAVRPAGVLKQQERVRQPVLDFGHSPRLGLDAVVRQGVEVGHVVRQRPAGTVADSDVEIRRHAEGVRRAMQDFKIDA